MNIAALGKQTAQLPVPYIIRFRCDKFRPASAWGFGAALPYDKLAAENVISELQQVLREPISIKVIFSE